MPICAIVNPRAGGWRRLPAGEWSGTPEETVTRWLTEQGKCTPDHLTVHVLSGPNQGANLARAAIAGGCETVIAVGGDGTINDVLQGMMGPEGAANVTLGLIPMGTANVLARILGLPIDNPMEAARIICVGNERRIDLGRAGTRWFALVAGVGFDGAATRIVNSQWKRRVGELAYVLAALRLALRYPRTPVRLTCDENPPETFDAYLVLVANGGQYGGRFRLGPSARLDDGLLDVYVCLRRGPLVLSIFQHGLALLQNRFEHAVGIRHFQARQVVVEAERELLVQLDGDAAGSTPLHIEIVPNALRVLVP